MTPRTGAVLLAAALILLPTIVYPLFLVKVLCFAMFAGAFDLLLGGAGLMSFGQAAFFGTGAYLAAYACRSWGFSPGAALLLAGAGAAALGAVIGAVAIRREGVAFTMITLALAQLVYFVAVETPATGGENGIQGVPRGKLAGIVPMQSDLAAYALVAILFACVMLLLHRARHSPHGEVLAAIRQNEARAVSLGYATRAHKLTAFVLAAAISGLAGGAKAWAFGLATLGDVHWTTSGEVALMVLLGGMGTRLGPLAGAALVVTLETYLAPLGGRVEVIEGAIFVACVLAFPGGLLSLTRARSSGEG